MTNLLIILSIWFVVSVLFAVLLWLIRGADSEYETLKRLDKHTKPGIYLPKQYEDRIGELEVMVVTRPDSYS